MRFEVLEILLDNSVEVLLTSGSFDYANKYFRFLNFKYGDYRTFLLKDNLKGISYEKF